jgi:hypothetical protein
MTARLALALALSFALLALFAPGCGKPGPGNVVVYARDGGLPMSMVDLSPDAWESSPWFGTDVHWIPYGPHVQLQLEHNLGRVPTGVITYISFVESGQNPSQAAGDLARLVEVTADHVTVWNDTNGSYFARVVVF